MRQPKMPRTERVPTATLIGSRAPLCLPHPPLHSHGQGSNIPIHCLSPGIPSRRDAIARCIPASWPCAYSAECEGGMVLRKWWHQKSCTLDKHLPRALQVGYPLDGLPQLVFLLQSGGTRNLREFGPEDFDSGCVPNVISKFDHIRRTLARPVPHGFCPRAAGPAPNFSAAKLKMVRVLSGSETT